MLIMVVCGVIAIVENNLLNKEKFEFGHVKMQMCINNMTIARYILQLILVGMLVYVMLLGVFKIGVFSDIGNQECSDKFTNQFFKDLDGKLGANTLFWEIIMIVLQFIIIAADVCYVIFVRYGKFRFDGLSLMEAEMIDGGDMSINSLYGPPVRENVIVTQPGVPPPVVQPP